MASVPAINLQLRCINLQGHKVTNGGRAVAKLFLLSLFAMVLAPLTSAATMPSKLPDGVFSTAGNQIVDQNHNPVRLSCVYWPGLNHQDGSLAGLKGPIKGIPANVEAIAAIGFDCIRIDFNNISLHMLPRRHFFLCWIKWLRRRQKIIFESSTTTYNFTLMG